MKILENDSFRTGLIIFILFLSIPFVMPDRTQVIEVPEGVRHGEAAGPFSKFFDRISGFYGFGKKGAKRAAPGVKDFGSADAITEGAAGSTEAGADKAAGKEGEGGKEGKDGARASALREEGEANFDFSTGGSGGSSIKVGGASAGGPLGKASSGKVTIGGKQYETRKGADGKRYALTKRGPIPVDTLRAMASGKGATTGSAKGGGLPDPATLSAVPVTTASSRGADGGSKGKGGAKSGSGVGGGKSSGSGLSLGGGGGSKSAKAKSSGGSGVKTIGGGSASLSREVPAQGDFSDVYNNTSSTAGAAVTETGGTTTTTNPNTAGQNPPGGAGADTAISVPTAPTFGRGIPIAYNVAAAAATDANAGTAPSVGQAETNTPIAVEDGTTATATPAPAVPAGVNPDVSIDIQPATTRTTLIPSDDNFRSAMTKELLGEGKVFVGGKPNEKGEYPFRDPWVVPPDISKGPGMSFYEANAAVFVNEDSKYQPGDWRAADRNYKKSGEAISQVKTGDIYYAFIDGGIRQGQSILTMQQGSFYDNYAKGLLGEDAKYISGGYRRVLDVNNVPEEQKQRAIIFIPSANTTVPKGYETVLFENNMITPDSIKETSKRTETAVNNIEKKTKQNHLASNTPEEAQADDLKKDLSKLQQDSQTGTKRPRRI